MKLPNLLLSLSLFLAATVARADEAAKAKWMAKGQQTYPTCMACHGADGQGLPVGPQKMAPSLTASPIATGDPAILALVILKGIAKEDAEYVGMMAPLEAALADDEALAGVMTYVRNSFGNTASVVTAADASGYREKWSDIKAPVTRAKLAELTK